MHTTHLLLSIYLYGILENQGIKLCEVLDMVSLNYMVVLNHQISYLVHVEQQLCHLTMGKKKIDNRTLSFLLLCIIKICTNKLLQNLPHTLLDDCSSVHCAQTAKRKLQ